MTILVNDMLFVARADQGELAQQLQLTSMSQEVEHVIEFFDASLEEADLSVLVTGDANVLCNPSLIRRAVANLLSNAIKHAGSKSTITVAIESAATSLWIRVVNQGTIVPSSVLDQMFTRFFRADAARASLGDSNGLGLSIVKAIAQMHGGKVCATSEAGITSVGFSLRIGTPGAAVRQ